VVNSEPEIDLDAIHRDLEDVEAALSRLDAGTYWTDEVTGLALDEALLLSDPLARRFSDTRIPAEDVADDALGASQ
jgi:RNA polymerase-binding transcription factor DksA